MLQEPREDPTWRQFILSALPIESFTFFLHGLLLPLILILTIPIAIVNLLRHDYVTFMTLMGTAYGTMILRTWLWRRIPPPSSM